MTSVKTLGMMILLATGTLGASGVPPPPEQPEWVAGEKLSNQERATQAALIHETLEVKLREVMVMLELARERKQAVRISCLADKLEQMTAHVLTARQIRATLEKVATIKEADSLAYYRQLKPRFLGMLALKAEAEACVGEQSGWAGRTMFTVTERQPYYGDPATIAEPVRVSTRPPNASPYQLTER